MDGGTAKHNLLKLMEYRFVKPVEDRMYDRAFYF